MCWRVMVQDVTGSGCPEPFFSGSNSRIEIEEFAASAAGKVVPVARPCFNHRRIDGDELVVAIRAKENAAHVGFHDVSWRKLLHRDQ